MEQNRSRRQAPERSDTEVSEAQIAVHWQEESYFSVPKDFTAQANLTDKGVFKRFALEKFPGCYKEFAELLDWHKKWDKIFDGSKPPFWRWFVGGKINASYNCVDRHLAKHRNKAAIHFVPEPEHQAIQHVTYQELYVRVNEFAAFLRDVCGLKAGDRVTLHMPMVAELPITMLACARLGVIHSQVFSGTTGKPKGAQHSIGGYLAYVTWTSKYVQDIHPEDVYWCMADIGWITGHSYIVYGPLALAASSVVYEGVPTHPDPGRPWRIAEELGVNIFHTSPTAIRALRKDGPDEPGKYNYRFKHMTTVGEPIEPEVWKWYFNVVGKKQAVIVDTWWQTETGGFLCSTMPGIHKMKYHFQTSGSMGSPTVVMCLKR